MARRTSNGKCSLCGGIYSKATMTKHLKSCKQRNGIFESQSGSSTAQKTNSFQLVVEGRCLPDYWMHVEASTNAALETLDHFLRDVWLECYGHLSAFTIQGARYEVAENEFMEAELMDAALDDVLSPGIKFYHEYDFGTTTELTLKVVSEQECEMGKPIHLLARNEPPLISCESCGKVATQVCSQCNWSGEGWLCNECVGKHECGVEMFLPVVNSPRVGMCGYSG